MPNEPAPAALSNLARELVRTSFGARATEPQPLAAGAWSQAFELTIDGAEAVLRVGAHGTDFAKDELVAGFARPGLPVPPVLARGVVDTWHYAISTRAHGVGFDDLSAADVALTLPSLLTTLDAIGEIDLSGTAGYGIWTQTVKLRMTPGRMRCWPSVPRRPGFPAGKQLWPTPRSGSGQ
ncbi:hypothetical protein [Streptomyces sp. NPDC059863]|uniref:hypothetical protein n=1 Tax=unclassified Streptomyces TaxID=2593676 RepID=UPI003650952E